jgi:two-component system CheB/CheR fusion protein
VGINNILSMTQESLGRALTMALHKAILSKEAVHYPHINASNHGVPMMLALNVRYIPANDTADTDLYLITLEERPTDTLPESSNISIPNPTVNDHIAELEQELQEQEAFLQLANQKLLTSNEELRLFNEEMQSLNEELQSSNEELETSKEELQSLNEELSTVNAELQSKVTDLSRTNNDMNNLLAGSNIGTVFVDHQLCIMRFTPAVTPILNLIPSDIGRPGGHIVSNLIGYAYFMTHIQAVLDTLIPKEVEVQTSEGKWYLMRIQPYRTLENVIEGAVISFVDISDLLAMRNALQKANEQARLAVVLLDASDAITMQDMNGKILAWNPAAVQIYGWTEREALQMNVRDTMLPANQAEETVAITKLSQSDVLEPYHTQRLTKVGNIIDVRITATALLNEHGKVYAIATTERAVRSQRD